MEKLKKKAGNLRNKATTSKTFKVAYTLMVVVATVVAEMSIQDFMVRNFPEYFESDAKQILESQRENFASLDEDIDLLRDEVSSSQGNEILERLSSSVEDVENENENLTKILASMRGENENLRELLREQTGLHGGADFRVLNRNSFKIDETTTVGVEKYTDSEAVVNVSTHSEGIRKRLEAGQGINYRNENGEPCRVTLMNTEGEVYRFSTGCTNEELAGEEESGSS